MSDGTVHDVDRRPDDHSRTTGCASSGRRPERRGQCSDEFPHLQRHPYRPGSDDRGSAHCFRVPDLGNWCRPAASPVASAAGGSLTHASTPWVREPPPTRRTDRGPGPYPQRHRILLPDSRNRLRRQRPRGSTKTTDVTVTSNLCWSAPQLSLPPVSECAGGPDRSAPAHPNQFSPRRRNCRLTAHGVCTWRAVLVAGVRSDHRRIAGSSS